MLGRPRDAARRALEAGAPVRVKQRKHDTGSRSRQGPGAAAAWSPAAERRPGGRDEAGVLGLVGSDGDNDERSRAAAGTAAWLVWAGLE